jgi:hypothetical protein
LQSALVAHILQMVLHEAVPAAQQHLVLCMQQAVLVEQTMVPAVSLEAPALVVT